MENINTEEAWERYCEGLPTYPFDQKYPNGEPMRFRCPYCGKEIQLDPHPGCCSEIHWEPIPPYELDEYTK